ncbi:hypothetical protein NM208_g10116 [Fusarium decemcellulare]|uniref:Uncharacterized protein n=1 Tax=Fusarium decemcellulare TaxID=57161 RepID=A0ACC1RZJ4_9HYPO|nr:hypothetical protein NM208_g10116 [Fusarium decemcellulare]
MTDRHSSVPARDGFLKQTTAIVLIKAVADQAERGEQGYQDAGFRERSWSKSCIMNGECFNCREVGHFKKDCPKRICTKCHELGHSASECQADEPDSSALLPDDNELGSAAHRTEPDGNASAVETGEEAISNESAPLTGDDLETRLFWLIDSSMQVTQAIEDLLQVIQMVKEAQDARMLAP